MGSSTAHWYLQDRIVFVHNVGDLSAENFRDVDKHIIAFMREALQKGVTEKVHVLVDSTEMDKLPRFTELEGGRILQYMREPNCGWTVVIGSNNPLLTVLSRLLTSIMGVNLYMADRFSKGISLFKQVDPTLLDLPDVDQWKQNNLSATTN
jgi:hypothetical protein